MARDLRELRSALYIAKSNFTARAYRKKFGIESTLIPPMTTPASCSTPTTGEFVTRAGRKPRVWDAPTKNRRKMATLVYRYRARNRPGIHTDTRPSCLS
ncbi:hypothetical protein MPL3365_170324 [Mesorhizobium plurifarium]|uniref:Uncharacterized protein n=1 Tax=Mesorhizobium plurifarium TaxID=69974 RepID=A0A090FZT4_MESPL|nr:hypothetical protein MPL3365_170324 [Mesorhizobium plurifarium]